MPEKKIKFNIIDVIILIAVVLAITFVGVKMFGGDDNTLAKEEMYAITLYSEAVPSFVSDSVTVESVIADETKSVSFGKAADVTVSDAVVYLSDSEGNLIKTAKEGYNSIEIKCEVPAVKGNHGILIEGFKYTIGHAFTLNAGDTKFDVIVSGISKK